MRRFKAHEKALFTLANGSLYQRAVLVMAVFVGLLGLYSPVALADEASWAEDVWTDWGRQGLPTAASKGDLAQVARPTSGNQEGLPRFHAGVIKQMATHQRINQERVLPEELNQIWQNAQPGAKLTF